MTAIHTFGPFRLDVAAGILFRGAEPVALGQRAVALLQVLVEGAGTPISKDALIELVRPGLAIADSNLTVQIAALRRVFAEQPMPRVAPSQSIPSLSLSRSLLAAALTKLGRIDEAKAVGLQVLALDPSFSANRFCAAKGVLTALAESLMDPWSAAGLPP